jgi:DNA processing protein
MPFFQSESFIRNALTLLNAPEIGPATFKTIYQQYPDLQAVFESPQKISHALGLEIGTQAYLSEPDFEKTEAALAWAEADDHFILFQEDEDYPILLRDIPSAPPILFVKGNKLLLNEPQIAIVGSRHMTSYGAENARAFASDLAQKGLSITSGLALGIDTEAHQGALEVGGSTIAVMGTGIDKIYPAINLKLARQIAEQGCLVSEMAFGTPPDKRNFPRRNRIISGLSLGVLVVEAALQSGSLITARFATEQNREVFAIPGSIHNALSKGCHALLKSGAKCVESAEDMLIELKPWLESQLKFDEMTVRTKEPALLQPTKKAKKTPVLDSPVLDSDYQQLYDFIHHDPLSINELIEKTGFAPNVVSSMLFKLELDGHVVHKPEGYARQRLMEI